MKRMSKFERKAIALIEEKILLCNAMEQKIETESGK